MAVYKSELWPAAKPVPYARNARKIPQQAIDKVAASLKEYGWRQPIVVDGEGVIIAGHTRLMAAKQLGMQEVPVHVAADLTPAQVQAYRLADNRTAQEASWDDDLLRIELGELQALDLDLPQLTAFDADELAQLLSTELTAGDPDETPALDEHGEPESKRGEMYELGPHRLLCGDSTVLDEVRTLMGTELADMVFTDPPYGVAYEGKSKARLTIDNDAIEDDAFLEFLTNAHRCMAAITKDGGAIYVCHADAKGHHFRKALMDGGWLFKQCVIWVKDSLVIGRQDYHWRHEPILYGWKPGGSHRWYSDRKQDTVWEIPRPKRSEEHPTMKPVELVVRALTNSSKTDDIIFEPFGGSGTTLIAAAKIKRRARLMEIDPRYCDVIRRRWTKYATENGIPAGSGALEPAHAG